MGKTMQGPEGRKFYGSVTVGQRGQVVIPAEARKDFAIKPGDKLLVLGDLAQGIAITTIPLLQRNLKGTIELFHSVQPDKNSEERG